MFRLSWPLGCSSCEQLRHTRHTMLRYFGAFGSKIARLEAWQVELCT